MMRFKSKSVLGALVATLAICGLTAASALAAGAPIVETKPATSIKGTEAKLNGHVNINGAATKYYFEYGPTASYGSKTAEFNPIVTREVSQAIESLTTSTRYHFRLVATNSYGTSYGADQEFTTTSEKQKPEFAVKTTGTLTEVAWYTQVQGSADWSVKPQKGFSCSAVEVESRITGTKTVEGKFSFTGCYLPGTESKCQSVGAKVGRIVTEELQGTLVYISKASKTVGLVFKPKSGELVTKFTCLWGPSEVRGGIIVPISPINLLQRRFTEGKLEVNFEENQAITEYENVRGEKVHSGLETNWPGAFSPLAWGVSEFFFVNANKEFEIQA